MGVRVETAAVRPRSVRIAPETLAVAALYLLAVVVYATLGRFRDVPLFNPDEFIYGHLAQSLAHGEGFDWRGQSQSLISALYVLLITPAWLFGSTLTGYAVAKVIGAIVVCTVVVPVYLLTRELLTARLALLAAALSLAGTWMTTSTVLLTENLALPLAAAALCATVMALREPGSRWIWVALGFAAAAALARAQLVVLVPVVLLALGADVARFWSRWRERAERHRIALIATGGITGAMLLFQLADPDLFAGTYYDPVSDFPLDSGVLSRAVHQWDVLLAMAGFAPVVLMLAVMCTRAGWRDEQVGPLLCVAVPATLVLAAQTAWFLNGLSLDFGIQRYVEYVVPLLLVLLLVVASRWQLVPRWAYALVPVLALLALSGGKTFPSETLAASAVGEAGEVVGASQWVSVALATLLVGLAAIWLVRRVGARAGGKRAALAAGLLTLAVLLLQSLQGWQRYIEISDVWRSGFPADLAWLDKAADGPVARLVVTASHPRWPPMELFNRDVTRVYALSTATGKLERGRTCVWTADSDGTAIFEPECGAAPRKLYVDDPAARVTFVGQRVVRDQYGAGRLIELPGPPAEPRLRSLLVLPCDDRSLLRRNGDFVSYFSRQCRTVVSGYFWLDRAETLVLGVRGGKEPRTAQIAGKSYAIAPNTVTTIRVPLPKGGSQVEMRFDDLELPLGYPDVVSAELQSAGSRSSIL